MAHDVNICALSEHDRGDVFICDPYFLPSELPAIFHICRKSIPTVYIHGYKMIQSLTYALLGIKVLYPHFGILPETSKMWKVHVGYKIGSYEPVFLSRSVRFGEISNNWAEIIPNGNIDFPLQLTA